MRFCLYQPDMAPNLGAAIRVAACFGLDLDIIEPCGFPLTAKDIKRVAMDYRQMAQPVRHASWDQWKISPEKANRRTILLTTKGATSLWDFTFQPDDIIMTGRESAGVPNAVHDSVEERVFIPMPGEARSLNVVVSASIAIAEATRQMAQKSN